MQEEPKRDMDGTRHSDNDMDDGNEPKKRIRHRKKLIINKLRAQLEFYFSAANLSKDKFMNKLLDYSPYIDVDIFFKFNRIRTLTDDLNLLKKAVEKSPMLELSEDGSKVKRSMAVKKKVDETCCTIYVENIPSHVDHEWVHEMFVKYGTIDYISFPRFKSTGRPKGFAFIEFENPDMANIALETFGARGCTIPSNTEPSYLRSICTHESADSETEKRLRFEESFGEQSKMKVRFEESDRNSDQSEVKDMLSDENGDKKRKVERKEEVSGKRKLEEVDDSENNAAEDAKAVQKKSKANSSKTDKLPEVDDSKAKNEKKTEDSVGETSEKTGDKETKRRKLDVEDVIREVRRNVDKEKGIEIPTKEETASLLSPRKRSLDESGKEQVKKAKKRKVMVDTTNSTASAVKATPPAKVKSKKMKRKRSRKEKGESLEGISLKVMSKQEWTRLRNHYLNMQKRNMESLKWDLQKRRYVPAINYPPPGEPVSKGQPKFVANAVIKISFEEPPQDPKKLQEAIREGYGGGVAYVETSAVEKDVYVRFVSGEAAAAYLKGGLWSRMVLLSGEEEEEYWNHCVNSWLMRRNKKNKGMKGTINEVPNKFRGREKLLQKALREAGSDKPNSHKVFEG